MKSFNYKIKQKLDEIYSIRPNDLGSPFLNTIYHGITKYFKTAPFIFVIPVSFVGTILLYFLFGALLVKLATVLQYGF